MPDLDQRIAAWRKEMEHSGIKDAAVLEELASHVREQTLQYVAGIDEETAFFLAVERLGEPAAMRRDFAKQRRGIWMPVVVIASVWVILNVVISGSILRNGPPGLDGQALMENIHHADFRGIAEYVRQSKADLAVNFISAIAGTSAVYASGILAMIYVWLRWREKITVQRERILVRAIEIFNGLIAALTAMTIFFGMLWIRREAGGFFPERLPEGMGSWTPATASLLMMFWFVAILASRRFWRSNPILLMTSQFGGNLVVLLSSYGVHVHTHLFWWPMDGPICLLIALNFLFLLLAANLDKSESLTAVE